MAVHESVQAAWPDDFPVATRGTSETPLEPPYRSLFVFGTWLLMTLIAVWFVARYGNRTPRWEDWFMVPCLTGHEQPTLGWFWGASSDGYRAPIVKLIFYVSYSIFGFNSKPILFLNLSLLSSLSLGLIWVSRVSRGRLHYCDAFFPIVLLNLGQDESFCWAQTSVYVVSVCMITLILMLIVLQRDPLRPRNTLMAGIILVFLPLTFGGGLVFSIPMLIWLTYRGIMLVRLPGRLSRYGLAMLSLVGMTAAIIWLYFVGNKKSDVALADVFIEPGIRAYAKTAWKFLSMSFGPAASWPIWPVSGLLIAGILLISFACLISQVGKGHLFRDARILNLSFYMASCMGVALAFGYGRYGWGDSNTFDSRYAILASPCLLGAYFVWELYGPKHLIPLGRMVLFSIVCAFISRNSQIGILHAELVHKKGLDFESDRAAGMSIPELISRHASITYYYHEKLENHLKQLRDAHVEGYGHLPKDPLFREQILPLTAAELNGVEWNGQEGKVVEPAVYVGYEVKAPYLRFELKESQFVGGLRIRFACSDPRNICPSFKVEWCKDDGTVLESYRDYHLSPSGKDIDVKIYVYKNIKSIKIFPNNRSCEFRISEIKLLLPE